MRERERASAREREKERELVIQSILFRYPYCTIGLNSCNNREKEPFVSTYPQSPSRPTTTYGGGPSIGERKSRCVSTYPRLRTGEVPAAPQPFSVCLWLFFFGDVL
jgi:hypothetical protein